MKRMLASGLGMTLGLITATGHAQEANWRAAKSQPTQPPAPVAQAPPQDGVRWVTARAKVSADDPPDVPNVLPTPGERPAAPGTLVTSVTEPAAAVTQSTTTGVHPNYLVGEDPCCTCVVERAP